jgi:hypothetical protein
VEIKRIYRHSGPTLHMSDDHAARREKIRRQKMYHAAAIMVQKHFRKFSARRKVAVIRDVRRIKAEEAEMLRRLAESNVWYTDNEKLPVKKTETAVGWVDKGGLKLPPIKTFGRHRDFLSHKGWGRWTSGGGTRSWAPAEATKVDKSFVPDAHFSRTYVDKLHISGYDEKRMIEFQEKRVKIG